MQFHRSESLAIAGRITILEARQTNDSSDVGPPLILTYTRKQAAELLHISESMLDLLTKDGKISVCRVGRRRLYTPEALTDYLKSTEKRSRTA